MMWWWDAMRCPFLGDFPAMFISWRAGGVANHVQRSFLPANFLFFVRLELSMLSILIQSLFGSNQFHGERRWKYNATGRSAPAVINAPLPMMSRSFVASRTWQAGFWTAVDPDCECRLLVSWGYNMALVGTKLCRFYAAGQPCRYGSKCTHSHGPFDSGYGSQGSQAGIFLWQPRVQGHSGPLQSAHWFVVHPSSGFSLLPLLRIAALLKIALSTI